MKQKKLEQRVRWLTIYAIGSILVLAVVVLLAFTKDDDRHFEVITAQRINIVSPDGTNRIVLSNKKHFPPPILDGKVFNNARTISPAGILFYGKKGNERGGIAISHLPGKNEGEQVALLFDYQNSEAISIGKWETADGTYYHSGITIYDRQPLDANILKVGSVGPERISIANDNGTAKITLNDSQGRPRIRLMVSRKGKTTIEVLDKKGKVVYSLPPK